MNYSTREKTTNNAKPGEQIGSHEAVRNTHMSRKLRSVACYLPTSCLSTEPFCYIIYDSVKASSRYGESPGVAKNEDPNAKCQQDGTKEPPPNRGLLLARKAHGSLSRFCPPPSQPLSSRFPQQWQASSWQLTKRVALRR